MSKNYIIPENKLYDSVKGLSIVESEGFIDTNILKTYFSYQWIMKDCH